MRARIDSACAGFLLTNAVSYLIALCAMTFGGESYLRVGWAGVTVGAVVSLSSGVCLFMGFRNSRILAAAACLFFAASSLYIFSVVKSHDFSPPWRALFSAVPVGSLICLVSLFYPLTKKEVNQPSEATVMPES